MCLQKKNPYLLYLTREMICAAEGERLGLILPTSLCSGEVARKFAEELEAERT